MVDGADQQVTLRDGRKLAYRDLGDRDAPPVVFNPGFMACRLTGRAVSGVRVLSLDRPGIGLSDPAPRRSLLDWPDDVADLADRLGIERFAVLGHSAGGPYAAACAVRLPDRVTALGIACGFTPLDRAGATAGMTPRMAKAIPMLRRAPWMTRLATASLPRQYRRDPDRAFHNQFGRDLPAGDVRALADTAARQALLDAAVESTRQGSRPLALEMRLLFASAWGFAPSAIRLPAHLWYGSDDTLTPLQMGEWFAAQIPGSTLTAYAGEGHMAALTHWQEIVTSLVA